MLTVTKKFDFCFAHFLPNYDGPCSRVHGHGGVLEVTISGPRKGREAPKGMICDFRDLKNDFAFFISSLDHSFLNELPIVGVDLYPEYVIMVGNPTAENIVLWSKRWGQEMFGDELVRIRFYETPDSYAEWTKE